MGDFGFYFGLGWEHIISADALDHQLFIAAIAAIYLLSDWKQVLILVTAFTIGHSLTLALSVMDIVRFPNNWVEFLIPVTIVITAFANLFQKKFTPRSIRINYFLAL
ncbi:MAG TPA: HupE/UreJ family protein, partial [Chitinophagaceae bacterium]|nr:HupE/UreJ family protein [Chitinophagaceae bacterium]